MFHRLNCRHSLGHRAFSFHLFANICTSTTVSSRSEGERWKVEYGNGANYEIYSIDTQVGMFNEQVFEGMTFADMGRLVCEANGSLLLALTLEEGGVRGGRVVLNPAKLELFRRLDISRLYLLGRSKEAVDAAIAQLLKRRRYQLTKQQTKAAKARDAKNATFGPSFAGSFDHMPQWTKSPRVAESAEGSVAGTRSSLGRSDLSEVGGGSDGRLKGRLLFKSCAEKRIHGDLPWFVDDRVAHSALASRQGSLMGGGAGGSASGSRDGDGFAAASDCCEANGQTTVVGKATAAALDRLRDAAAALATLRSSVDREVAIACQPLALSAAQGTGSSSLPTPVAATLGLVSSAEAMLGAATAAVLALPHQLERRPDHPFADAQRVATGGGGDGPAHGLADCDGHVVVDAFSSSLRSIMAVLVAVRRLTDLDVVVMLSSDAKDLTARLRERLLSLDRSRHRIISGRPIAKNVFLVTSHKDLNIDALLEARVECAVSLIMLRSSAAESDFAKYDEADNRMLVKSSMVYHSLVNQVKAAVKNIEQEALLQAEQANAAVGAATGTSPGGSSGQMKGKVKGPRMSLFGGGEATATATGSEVSGHFDLHLVHQMYTDHSLAFLSQSTEVPNFDEAKTTAGGTANHRISFMSAMRTMRREQMIEEGLDPVTPENAAALNRVTSTHLAALGQYHGSGSNLGASFDAPALFGRQGRSQNEDGLQGAGALDDEDDAHEHGATPSGKRMDRLRSDALFSFPVFAAGRVHTESMMELLMAQAYFNPSEIKFWEALLGIDDQDLYRTRAVSVGGGAASGTVSGTPLDELPITGDGGSSAAGGASHYDNSLAELLSFSEEPLQLTEVNAPRDLVGQPYSAVCDHLASAGSVALGLYRPSGTKGASMPYMCTNPPAKTRVVPGDRVLVLRANDSFVAEDNRRRQAALALAKKLAAASAQAPGQVSASGPALFGDTVAAQHGELSTHTA